MELRHLRSLLVLAEELHFGRAADRLGIAQPALTRQIQQLETELQGQLFRRSPRAVSLTDLGREFVESISPAIQQIETAAANATSFAQAKRGRLRVGASSNLSYVFVPSLLEGFHQESPLVRVDVRELSTAEQVRTLHSGEIDIGLATLPINDPSLIVRRIFNDPLVVMVSDKSELAHRSSVRLQDLAHERFILCPRYRESGFHELTLDLAAKAGFRPRIVSETDAKEATVALVERGLGVSLALQSAALTITHRVQSIPIGNPEILVEIGAVWKRENMTPLVRRFLECAVSLGREIGPKRRLVA